MPLPNSREKMTTNHMTRSWRPASLTAALLTLLLTLAGNAMAQPVDFRTAMELALQHSGTVMAASADRAKAAAHYHEARDAYFPTVIFGSGLGYSIGMPVAIAGQAPSLYNITHNQMLFNLSTRDTMKAAHSDTVAANLDYADKANQVLLDTALLYIELDNTTQRLAAATEQKQAADHALYIAQQREKEGVGSHLDSKRSELESARVEVRLAELETARDVAREKLARVIGHPSATLETVSGSIPEAPALPAPDDLASVALATSDSVKVADEHVVAAKLRARAEHHMMLPSVDFAGQFAEFTRFNNYAQYYKEYSPHNYSFGLNIRIPVMNLSQNARAAAADAEALRAEAEARLLRDKVAAEVVRAQHTVSQLQSAAKVSRLEYEVAQAEIDAVELQVQNGQANAHDMEMAHAAVAAHHVSQLQSQYEFLRAQLQLLRQTGDLRSWALGK